MKKVSLKLAVLSTLIAATTAFADVAPVAKGYTSAIGPMTSDSGLKKRLVAPTSITVVNASYGSIHVVIPGTSIHDTLYNTDFDHIRNYSGAFNTTVTLEDTYHTVFWNQMVCPRAMIVVFGQPGSYRITTDTEYCY